MGGGDLLLEDRLRPHYDSRPDAALEDSTSILHQHQRQQQRLFPLVILPLPGARQSRNRPMADSIGKNEQGKDRKKGYRPNVGCVGPGGPDPMPESILGPTVAVSLSVASVLSPLTFLVQSERLLTLLVARKGKESK
ncbi:uncharacterized protein SPSK_06711 [Sporothrix schenckii 1099-18]|uniref:Uncharacterized protein n=1 Tax=Sporothrix schenckii 1099-18 TaxID=1397361 RepID=A0A0F2MIR0_SPOSC|nr:uncharacterized protein SPSK_06711 [Sporothrix schenckii 1099-18]KJR89588.1 hypothetical protein SPSK_06711 [Sporothrix schenckii 1099-18]